MQAQDLHSSVVSRSLAFRAFPWLTLLLLLIFGFSLELSIGSIELPWADLWNILWGVGHPKAHYVFIVWDVRLPRALTAILAGSSLGVAGLLMQTLFRNPLADPYVMGVSSGASLGVALITLGGASMGYAAIVGYSLSLAAGCGAILLLAFILAMSKFVPGHTGLLLMGIMTGYAVGALVQILTYFSSAESIQSFAMWSMGDYGRLALEDLSWPATLLSGCLMLCFAFSPQLNVFLHGDNYAKSLGLSVHKFRWILILLAGLLSGTVTAMCGPIGFIGLTVPHVARRCFKSSNHVLLVPACILIGSCLSLMADWLAQWPGSSKSLPLNAITALLGAPVVIVVILRQRRIFQE